jgi:hypothetical protein
MKSEFAKYTGHLAAAILAVSLFTLSANAQSERSAASPLEGTWRVQVTLHNCADPSITFPPFWSVLSFQRGGTESETTSNPALLPGQRTSGFGFWERTGGNTYFSATEAFILFDSPTNPPGLKKGVQKILQTIVMTDDNDWTADATVAFFNNDGTSSSGCANAQGFRLTGSTDAP